MIRWIIIFFLLSTHFTALSCSCGNSVRSDFMAQVKKFDLIISGTFFRDDNGNGYFLVSNTFKGTLESDKLNIWEGGLDCTEVFDENYRKELVVGLIYSGGNYSAPSCITSVLTIEDSGYVNATIRNNIHIRDQRISPLTRRMKLDRFVRKVERK